MVTPRAVPFQAKSLPKSPSYPNAVVWSDDNLIAVANGDTVTILNPENVDGARGVINVLPDKPFPIGVIDRDDLSSGCLLPICLARDRQPCVRSVSWSPVGYTPTNGCLLAVCSTEGRVKIYREPFSAYRAEWIEVMDISDLLHKHLATSNYGESETSLVAVMDDSAGQTLAEYAVADMTNLTSTNKRKRADDINLVQSTCTQQINPTYDMVPYESNVVTESIPFSRSLMRKDSIVEVFDMDDARPFWRAGILVSFEGSKVLVQFCEADKIEEQWFGIDSMISMRNTNHHDLSAAGGTYDFPQLRPSMNAAHFPEEIFSVKHEVGKILKAGQVLEIRTGDRWLEGLFIGFADKDLLVKPSGDTMAVSLHPSDVRFPPVWNAGEKSWMITVVSMPEVGMNRTSTVKQKSSSRKVPAAVGKKSSNKRTQNRQTDNVLKPHQYALRSSMMASLVVAWSPVLKLSANDHDESCDCFCLLAVGTKFGTISIWKFNKPTYYSLQQHADPINVSLVGVLHAHSTWVTALSWVSLPSDTSPQTLFASGCSNGSVKIWVAHTCDFKRSSEANQTPFSLFSEITVGDNALVSTLSLCIRAQSRQNILVAVGKGSGSFEVWTFDRETNIPKKVGSYDAHAHAVTGLAWAFDGYCLYSCSQDNSIYAWIYHKGTLFKASIPPNNPGSRSFSDLPSVSDSSYGIAVSPANLAIVVARRFDAGQLDHMYQKRTQKAAVEFFWIGGQEVNISQQINLNLDVEPCPGFTKEELLIWGSKLLWSLNLYESCDKQLVVWDVLAAMLAFKQFAPEFIEQVILTWVELLVESYSGSPMDNVLSDLPHYVSQISSRQLYLLNILCRRVMGCKFAKISVESYETDEEEKWMPILLESEKELRERLVGLTLSTVLVRLSHKAAKVKLGSWNLVGIGQMVKWVMQNQDHVHQDLFLLAAEVRGNAEWLRLQNVCDYAEEEFCCCCSASVPFKAPEDSVCVQCGTEEAPLARCAVSMQVSPLTPSWFCVCCHRQVSNLPPHQLHYMVDRPSDFVSFVKPVVKGLPNPLCPFCGISLQRKPSKMFLSKSPV